MPPSPVTPSTAFTVWSSGGALAPLTRAVAPRPRCGGQRPGPGHEHQGHRRTGPQSCPRPLGHAASPGMQAPMAGMVMWGCHGLAHGHATPNVPTASELGHQAGSGLVEEIPQAGPDMRCYEPRFLKLGDHHKVKTQFNLLIYKYCCVYRHHTDVNIIISKLPNTEYLIILCNNNQ